MAAIPAAAPCAPLRTSIRPMAWTPPATGAAAPAGAAGAAGRAGPRRSRWRRPGPRPSRGCGNGGAASENSPTTTSSAAGRARRRAQRSRAHRDRERLRAWRRRREHRRGGAGRNTAVRRTRTEPRAGRGRALARRASGGSGSGTGGRRLGAAARPRRAAAATVARVDGPLPEHPHPHAGREERLRPGGDLGRASPCRAPPSSMARASSSASREALPGLHRKCTADDGGQRRRHAQRLEVRRGAGEDGHVGVGVALEGVLAGEAGVQHETRGRGRRCARGGPRGPPSTCSGLCQGMRSAAERASPTPNPETSVTPDRQTSRCDGRSQPWRMGPSSCPSSWAKWMATQASRTMRAATDGREPPAHREDLGEGLAVGVLDRDGEPAVGLVEAERGLHVRVMEGVGRARDLPPQTLPGRGVHTRQVDDARHASARSRPPGTAPTPRPRAPGRIPGAPPARPPCGSW